MKKIVFIEGCRFLDTELWEMIAWCHNEMGYMPEVQASSVCRAFKFASEIDAMAFKLRWL